jgi:CDP-2,3-bis-(O-geranylgeranyl)-sn-glycerol synthase
LGPDWYQGTGETQNINTGTFDTTNMDTLVVVVTAVWTMLPAYVPNNAAVLAGGGPPIDGGRMWGGRRVLGGGKTWRGTSVGWAAGVVLAALLNELREPVSNLLGVTVPGFPGLVVLALPLGAMLGDMAASFLKRRSGRRRGAPFPGLDQLDFLVGALVLTAVVDFPWFRDVFTPPVLATVLVVTPLLHVTTNAIAYWLGVKNEPW